MTNHSRAPWVRIPSASEYILRASDGSTVMAIRDGVIPMAQDGALIAAAPELLAALEALYRECAMVHKAWGSACNQKEGDAAIAAGRAAIQAAKGGAA